MPKLITMRNINLHTVSLVIVISIMGFSCSDDILDEINKNPNAPTDVPISLLLPQATISVIHGVAGDGGGEYACFLLNTIPMYI
jgi:hypothetical protein